MNNKNYISILSRSGRLLVAGLMVMALQAGRVQAQYVSTSISNNLYQPYGVAADPNNNVYITDTLNQRIIKYAPGTGNIVVLAGQTGIAGTNNGTGLNALFNLPEGIVYSPARGGLVVVDQANQELRLVTTGGVVTTLAGSGQSGYVDSTNLLQAQFSNPTAVAEDSLGNLYIADQGNRAIRKLSTNNAVSTLATNFVYNSVTNLFRAPASVAVDNNNNVWMADTYYQIICMISNGVGQIVAGKPRAIGTNDSLTATSAEFDEPCGLLWDPANNFLVISDTGNDTIRSLYFTTNESVPGYAVKTLAGVPRTSGFVDGALGVAEFSQPFGLCLDFVDDGYYVVDQGNNALRVLQPSQPPAAPVAVTNPVIGYLTFPIVNGEPSATFNPIAGTGTVFNNPQVIAIYQDDHTVTTYYDYGPTGSVPLPTTSSPSPTVFNSDDLGLLPSEVPPSQVSPLPDMTIYAFSAAPPRPTSPTVSAEIQFVTANPNIAGNNTSSAASAILTDNTINAQIFYTLDGNTPTNGAADTLGPVLSGANISFALVTNTTLSVLAIAPNFAPSQVATIVFSPTNVIADEISFGFATGEGSSQFITAPGQTFIAPVTMSLIPSAEVMYTLQFSLAVTNVVNGVTAPPIPTSGSNALTFSSMLVQPIYPGPIYIPIPPEMVGSFIVTTNATNVGFTNLLFTNIITNELLGVGWVERPPATNLYNTLQQTLITYSQAHDTVFMNTGGEVIVGGYSFHVPTTATLGQQYEIQIGSPSATSDGISTAVLIQTPTNGSLTNGAINATKIVTVGQAQYLVGDVAPFYWFNAGDFGNGLLENNDVTETFQTAIYGLNGTNAATQRSDYFDAMDSSDGTDNNYYLGTDVNINNIKYGDGVLAVDDVYVTYRRSLDPTLTWYDRSDTSSGKLAIAVSNLLAQPFAGTPAPAAAPAASGPRYITVAGDQVQSGGNLTVQVPIRVLAADTLPITVMMLHVEVEPLDGSPALASPISFSSVANLGTQFDSATQAPGDFAAAWLNSGGPGVSGTGVLGTLTVNLPSSVTTNSAYLVHFDHFSASPNGLALFHATVQDGLITVGNRSGSSWNDGIPDSWRLLWFGTVSNMMSAANADPDGDGANNWDEYVAGTNPNDPSSVFEFSPGSSFASSNFTLQWQSVVNKTYFIQSSPSVAGGKWATLATNILGTGQTIQWTDSNATGGTQFYRALVQ